MALHVSCSPKRRHDTLQRDDTTCCRLNYCEDQPESFVRRRAVERKHGRIAMMAMTGILVHNADIEFPGYLSKSQDLKFHDIPNGIAGISKVPSAGLLQILLFTGLIELAWWPANNYSGRKHDLSLAHPTYR